MVKFDLTGDYKITANRDGIVEKYNPSYTSNTKVNTYVKSITLSKNGETFYLPLTSSNNDDSKITTHENLYPSNGMYSDIDQYSQPYELHSAHYTRNITNGWNFSFDVENLDNTIPSELLDDALRRVNSAFPSANITLVESSDNYIVLDEYEDTWLGLCTSWSNKVRIELNNTPLIDNYGTYNSDTSTSSYKKWLGTTVHEFGHTFGNPDQASHTPSLYDYSRDRERATYLQANDIAWLKHAYCDLNGCDESIFEVSATSRDISPRSAYLLKRNIVDEGECVMNFDYVSYDSASAIEDSATNIVVASLTFSRTESLNIGSDVRPKYMDYNIYTINIITEEKGSLTNKELKIPVQEKMITCNGTYRLYLKEYIKTPCSLVNMKEGIIKLTT